MSREEFDWIDDAFADSKDDAPARDAGGGPGEYDWIDDAFDDRKEDPLAKKGMTGCSSLAVLLCGIAVVLIIAFLAFAMLDAGSLFIASR